MFYGAWSYYVQASTLSLIQKMKGKMNSNYASSME